MHSFDEETRKIFRILIVFTFSSFKLSWFAHLTKETVSGKLHYQQWNYIFLFLCFCRCFSFSIAEQRLKSVVSSGPQWYLLSTVLSVWHCPPWPFLAFLPAENFVWHYCVDHIVKLNTHLTGIIICSTVLCR